MSIFLFLLQKLKEKISKIKIFKLKYLSLKNRDRQTEKEREQKKERVYIITQMVYTEYGQKMVNTKEGQEL